MKPTKYEKWLAELRAELLLLDDESITPLARLKQALLLTSEAINDLKTEVLQNSFSAVETEIHFFKLIKPAFYALQIFEIDFYVIASNAPSGTREMLKAYYEQELLYLFRFFRTHAFHYQYFRSGARELDRQYFTRDGKPGDIPVLENIDVLPGFSTPLDYLFAKFIAYEKLQLYLIDQLTILYGEVRNMDDKNTNPSGLRWTGESINLVEVAYGLWLSGQLNNGNATIAEIVRWLEKQLSVKIGTPFRRWTEISGRTHRSPTRFLDRMRDAIKQRIDEELQVRSQKRKARRTGES